METTNIFAYMKKCKRKEIPQIAITVYAQLVTPIIFHFESDPELAIQSKSNQIFKTETITTTNFFLLFHWKQEKKIDWYRKSVEVVTMNDNQSVCSHFILFLFQSLVFRSRQRWFLQKQMMVAVFRRLKWQCIFPFALVFLLLSWFVSFIEFVVSERISFVFGCYAMKKCFLANYFVT